jgi:hypothetical protein
LASSQHAAYSDACGTATKYFANACTRYCPVQTRTPVYFKLERKNTHEWQLLQRFLPAWCGLYGLLVPGVVLDGWLGCGGLTPQRLAASVIASDSSRRCGMLYHISTAADWHLRRVSTASTDSTRCGIAEPVGRSTAVRVSIANRICAAAYTTLRHAVARLGWRQCVRLYGAVQCSAADYL